MRRHTSLFALLGALAGAALIPGCTRATVGFCTQNTDCGSGFICKLPDAECIATPSDFCTSDDACAQGQYCKIESSQCVTATIVHGEFSGGQLSPPTASNAAGSLRIILQPGQQQGTAPYTLKHNLSSAVQAIELHLGKIGTIGGQEMTLDPQAQTGTITLNSDFTTALTAGGVYVVIKTAAMPSGEVRAQLFSLDPQHASGTFTYVGILSGLESLPSNNSTSVGKVQITYNDPAGTIDFTYSHSGLKSAITGNHLHHGGFNVDGGLVVDLPPDNVMSANGTLSRSNIYASERQSYGALIKSGVFYQNIHSADFPKGELRGQVVMPVMINGVQATATPFNTALLPPGGGLAATGETQWFWSADKQKLAFRLTHNVTAAQKEAIVVSGTPTSASTSLRCPDLVTSNDEVGTQGFCDVAQVATAGALFRDDLSAGKYFFAIRNKQTMAIEVQGQIKVPAFP